jgi:hypothetical protein
MANEYLKRTPTSSGNKRVFTISAWTKISETSNASILGNSHGSGSTFFTVRVSTDGDTNSVLVYTIKGGTDYSRYWNLADRDPSSWIHHIFAFDTTALNVDDRVIYYRNGAKVTAYSDVYGSIPRNYEFDILTSRSFDIFKNGDQSTFGKGQIFDYFFVDGQQLTPDVFGFYKDGNGYQSVGTAEATDFRPGQWSPRLPKSIKYTINRSGGFGANGLYLPMNDSSNPGADFHCEPNSIIKLKGEDLPQPQNGAPTTTDAYVSQLRPEKEGTLGFDGCVRFDGTDDRLEIANNIDLELESSDFCIEAFIFVSELKNSTIVGNNQSSGAAPAPAGYEFDIFSSGAITFYSGNGSTYSNTGSNLGTISATDVIKTGQWYHVAAVRNGNTLRLYVDGNKVAENTSFSHAIVSTNNTHRIGNDGVSAGSSYHFNGLISNVRLVKGSPVYTANFTAPTEPLTNVTNTKLLCCQSSTDATAATVTPGTITTNGNTFATKNEILGSMVLAVPGASTATGANLVTNGSFHTDTTGWTAVDAILTWNAGRVQTNRTGGSGYTAYQAITVESGKRYTVRGWIDSTGSGNRQDLRVLSNLATSGGSILVSVSGVDNEIVERSGSFTATGTTHYVYFVSDNTGTGAFDKIVLKQEDAPRDYSADIKGSGTNKTLTAVGGAGVGYELGGYYGSAMTFDGSGDYFDISESNNEYDLDGDYTIEFWVNFNSINNVNDIIGTANNTAYLGSGKGGWVIGYATFSNIGFRFGYQNNSSWVFEYDTGIMAVANQWYHVAISHSGSTQQIIINGVVVHTATQTNTLTSTENVVRVGGGFGSTSGLLNGQIQDFRIYKGVAKYKGGFDVPKPYTPVGIEAFRTTADTCKNNFATWNAVDRGSLTLSDGNLSIENSGSYRATRATVGIPTTGKWYYEHRESTARKSNVIGTIGIAMNNHTLDGNAFGTSFSGFYWGSVGLQIAINGVNVGTSWVPNPGIGDGDILNIAYDADSRNIWFGINGTYYTVSGVTLNGNGNPTSGTNPTGTVDTAYSNDGIFPYCNAYNTISQTNFGQNPSFSGTTTAGTFTDDNGKGLFKYAPPTGFLALCEDNLPAPAIADPGEHFKCVLYTGSGASKAITGVGFKPDLIWVKSRTNTEGHILFDSVRGPNVRQLVHTNTVEGTAVGAVNSFDDDGFSTGVYTGTNQSGQEYVAWCWKAGGAAVANTDGTIASQVSVNQTAGFSCGTFTGNLQANQSIGHGLGKVPAMVVVKERNANSGWAVYHKARGNTKVSYWHIPETEFTETDSTSSWALTSPTSDVFYVGANGATNDNNLAFYAWAEIEGYSKFGSYVGNGDDDGPFVYCGFKPAFIMIKLVTGSERDWHIYDSSRNPTNPVGSNLRPSTDASEIDEPGIDFLSNGFKIRKDYVFSNESGQTIIFMAFAESPFQTANAK